tara:strand:- start:974 stop:1939 length:966 start_codon:yes stop_codon:yes gene_type:complete
MEEIKQSIWKLRPTLKETTVKQYIASLKKLQKNFETDNFDFLNFPESVKEQLEGPQKNGKTLHFTSQRNMYTAIIIYLLIWKGDPLIDDNIKIYEEWRDELNVQYEKQQESGIISDKQAPNFITKDELLSFIKLMKKDIKKDKQTYMVYVLFEILTRIPVRNDLAGLTLLNYSDKDKGGPTNYLVKAKGFGTGLKKDTGGFTFVDNQFKTNKKYGTLEIPIEGTSELALILRSYIYFNDFKRNDVLFPITQNYLSQLLIKYSKQYIGKSISTTLIRKIITTDKFLDTKLEQEAHAKMLGHSVGVENKVYIKKQQPTSLSFS